MRIFISTGEPSGDLHAANLIHSVRKIRPDAQFVGFGGPRMREAGAEILYNLVELAVMWFGRVLLNLHKFVGVVNQAEEYFKSERPDAVVLIDYPGLNWWIARKAKEQGIPVFYYVPPQIWAWAGWRVKKVRKYVDHVLCSLPFEPDWYHERGVLGAVHIGHPYFDELTERVLDDDFVREQRARRGPVVAILPGSRTQEVTRNLPTMLRAAQILSGHRDDVRFVVACLHERHQTLAWSIIEQCGVQVRPEVYAAKTAELIHIADVAWAVSGSVGLELMAEALPSVVLYKLRPFDMVIARPFIKAKYISLVNLLADRELFPEYLTSKDVSGELAEWARKWIDSPEQRAMASTALAELRSRVAAPGASDRAARRIVDALAIPPADPGVSPSYAGPHRPLAPSDGTPVEPKHV